MPNNCCPMSLPHSKQPPAIDRLKTVSHIRELTRLPDNPAERKRIQNLLGGRFIDMYEREARSHEYNCLLPSAKEIMCGVSDFPSILQVVKSFDRKTLAHATNFHDPVLLLYPPLKTRSDLLRNVSRSASEKICRSER